MPEPSMTIDFVDAAAFEAFHDDPAYEMTPEARVVFSEPSPRMYSIVRNCLPVYAAPAVFAAKGVVSPK